MQMYLVKAPGFQVGPESNDRHPYKKEETQQDDVEVEEEIRAMLMAAKGLGSPQKLEEAKREILP